jgi:peptidoglycan/xylan/chitin deacetylase (PgdA/CDA1 family)
MIRCTVLAYPGLGAESFNCPGSDVVSPEIFASQMHYLAENGFSVISLSQLCDAFAGVIALPDKAVALTFDADCESIKRFAQPILHQFGFKATAFARESPRQGGELSPEWRDLLTSDWSIGQDFGYAAWRFGPPSAMPTQLLADSKDRFEQMLGAAVSHCSYAAGSISGGARRLLGSLGYETGSSTAPSPGNCQIGPLLIRRVSVDARDQFVRFAWKLWRSGTVAASPVSIRQAA